MTQFNFIVNFYATIMNLKHAFAFLLLICIGSIPLKSRAVGIEFNHGSWAEIVSKAKAENKLIFIDFYTQWCLSLIHI